ncbi:MAG: XRE family transcriptional regulator [Lachnospiraceae bacterium]|nr:XRE family transcriptional regulator [Lachnospiraceae bacterium]
MEDAALKIGEHLREIRKARQLTLEDVAECTGVSKPMLGQIERGQSSPTINTLWKISTGLKMPLSFFCRQQEAEYAVSEPEEKAVITEEDGRMRAYPLFPFDPARNVEVFYIEFDAGVRHDSAPHVKGVEEYVFLVQGTLSLRIGDEEVLLQDRQSIRFQADVPHAYHNASKRGCVVYNMIFYPSN